MIRHLILSTLALQLACPYLCLGFDDNEALKFVIPIQTKKKRPRLFSIRTTKTHVSYAQTTRTLSLGKRFS